VIQVSGRLVCQSCTLAGTSIMAFSCIRVTQVATTEGGKLHALATTVLSVSLLYFANLFLAYLAIDFVIYSTFT